MATGRQRTTDGQAAPEHVFLLPLGQGLDVHLLDLRRPHHKLGALAAQRQHKTWVSSPRNCTFVAHMPVRRRASVHAYVPQAQASQDTALQQHTCLHRTPPNCACTMLREVPSNAASRDAPVHVSFAHNAVLAKGVRACARRLRRARHCLRPVQALNSAASQPAARPSFSITQLLLLKSLLCPSANSEQC